MNAPGAALLEVDGLNVGFKTSDGLVRAVTDVSFRIDPGEVLAVVGESGSGKSVTALALMKLHPRSAVISGTAMFDGVDLLALGDADMRAVRGNSIAMVFQDPMTALNPVFTVGFQISEAVLAHNDVTKKAAWARTVELLDLVGVPEPRQRASQYPHEFSGGMRQRAMIAMAISNDPKLLIADEPTTALDVTVQAQVMEVLREVRKETGAAMMLITHDLGLVAGAADRVQVMYASRLFEAGAIDDIFYDSRNPYTRALLGSIPQVDSERTERLLAIPGNPPSLLNPSPGCPFMPRCSERVERCTEELPTLLEIRGREHRSRCHLAQELAPISEVLP
ncbi:MAG: ABC transporter ATP-binding protein [Ilumatobacter sp.]|jgi:peptide/nickel transport system ATP-binding protein|nr:MAG: ABC transporter ATP-binding protein [Ilumatobacter sp.]